MLTFLFFTFFVFVKGTDCGDNEGIVEGEPGRESDEGGPLGKLLMHLISLFKIYVCMYWYGFWLHFGAFSVRVLELFWHGYFQYDCKSEELFVSLPKMY